MQTINIGRNGADSRRVLDALTPLTGTAAPAVQAAYYGQTFVDTTAKKIYMAVDTESVDPADDWVEMAQQS